VFEIAKVAMVMYLAWALDALRRDQEEIAEKGESNTLYFANMLVRNFTFMAKPFWKRAFYLYLPMLITCAMVLPGSNSSAIFLGFVMLATIVIGGAPLKEIFIAVVIAGALVGSAAGLYHVSDGKIFGGTRVGTMLERIGADYSVEQLESLEERSTEWYKVRDAIKQPYTARIAVHEGGIIGKGSGNSTQKYVVTHIYSDYMFSFIVEEYGLLGGIFIIILFVSLLARGSTIARFCNEEYAQILVGGLSLMITCQAFMHISVNVGIGPMTGQTLPLISDGSFAYLMFCFAFGVILSISRLAKKQIQEEEEAFAKQYGNKDDIQVAMDVLDEINSDNNDI
jgi:cell division protein FtsW